MLLHTFCESFTFGNKITRKQCKQMIITLLVLKDSIPLFIVFCVGGSKDLTVLYMP